MDSANITIEITTRGMPITISMQATSLRPSPREIGQLFHESEANVVEDCKQGRLKGATKKQRGWKVPLHSAAERYMGIDVSKLREAL